jgi:hypothetical protein
MLPHAQQLPLIQCAGRLQPSRQQRQPAIAAGQHVGDELEEPPPTLIVERQQPIDCGAERIFLLVRQGAAGRLFVAGSCVGQHLKTGCRTGGHGQLARQPCIEGVDGLDAQPRRLAPDVDMQGVEMPARNHRQSPGLTVHAVGTDLEAGCVQRPQHAFAHLLCRAAREGERQDALGRIGERQ